MTRALVLAGVLVWGATVLAPATPAGAAPAISAQGVALAPSASCTYGDVDITYDAHDAAQQSVMFSAVGGAVLHDRATKAYKPAYAGTEHVLAQAATPPPPGTVVAVHVVVGAAATAGANAAEFSIAYRCDSARNSAGGHNEVLWSCFGDLGSCPVTADDVMATAAIPGAVPGATTAVPVATPAAPVKAYPSYSG